MNLSSKLKFRAWDKDQEKMIYSNKIPYDYDFSIREDGSLACSTNCCYCDSFGDEHDDWKELDNIMQYTGKHDKNDIEIYEGDIIEGGYHNPLTDTFVGKKYVVEYTNCHFTGRLIGHSPYGDQWLEFIDGEVLGNSYENPELLGGKDES